MGHYRGKIKEAKDVHIDIFTDHRQDDLTMALTCDTCNVHYSDIMSMYHTIGKDEMDTGVSNMLR